MAARIFVQMVSFAGTETAVTWSLGLFCLGFFGAR